MKIHKIQTLKQLASESIQNNRNINEKRNGNKNEKRNNSSKGMRATTSKCSKLNLNHISESQHKESTTGDRSNTGDKHTDAESRAVNVSDGGGDVSDGGRETDGLLECESDETREEERAEGVDMEGY